jgi:hypothetical protein
MFNSPQTAEAGTFLLLNVLNDEFFVEASQFFGTDLLSYAIISQ